LRENYTTPEEWGEDAGGDEGVRMRQEMKG